MTANVRALVLTGFGLNCDLETAYALEMAGASADRVHINTLVAGEVRLDDYQIMAFGGGFGWGDDHGAGVLQAVRMRTNLGPQLLSFVDRRGLVIGICNGFQTLVNLGLLPGFDGDYQSRSIALTFNDCGNFRDDWVHLKIATDSPCVFTRGMEALDLPIRHGEGKFYADAAIIERLEQNRQIVLRYADSGGNPAEGRFPHNPNGSLRDIAGVCDATGRIFGLMPHPEAFNHWTNHPDWTREAENRRRQGQSAIPDKPTPGIRIFANAVNYLTAEQV
jgi:phosphoribosylformylglycinamidine synthase